MVFETLVLISNRFLVSQNNPEQRQKMESEKRNFTCKVNLWLENKDIYKYFCRLGTLKASEKTLNLLIGLAIIR